MNPTRLLPNKNRASLLALVGAFALLAPRAEAAVILTPTENNFTMQSNPNDVQDGYTNSLRNKVATSSGSSAGRTVFLKFDLADSLPSIGNDATLTLTTSNPANADFTIRIYALNAGVDGYDWTESALTWNNSPALGTTASSHFINLAEVTQLGSFDLLDGAAVGSAYSVPLTVTDWDSYLQTDNTITLITVVQTQSNSTGQILFNSSGNGSATTMPQLTIVPEPGSVALAALGLGALTIFRRRKSSR